MRAICLLILWLAPLCAWRAHVGSSLRRLLSASLPLAVSVAVSVSSGAADGVGREIDFKSWLTELDAGRVERVVFNAINPTELRFYGPSSTEPVLVRAGFPAFDDPLSPSGPAQAIARCQHSPGVTCKIDVSSTVALFKSRSRTGPSPARPLLQHSAYPKELAYPTQE